jgi:hypothetical protein
MPYPHCRRRSTLPFVGVHWIVWASAKLYSEATAGLIRQYRGAVEIVDRQGLEAQACECYAMLRRLDRMVLADIAADGAIAVVSC